MAAAIALRRAGLKVSLFEQTVAQGEVGAGIQISPNASRLLGRYGLGDAMVRVAVRPSAIVFRRWQDGRVLGREELGDSIEGQYGAPYYHFHRADLIALLVEAFGPKDIKLGRRLVDIEQDESGVTAHFQDGASERGDLLIGADGIHSRVRERLFGEENHGSPGRSRIGALLRLNASRISASHSMSQTGWGQTDTLSITTFPPADF
jgi:salicylate hydroxylase